MASWDGPETDGALLLSNEDKWERTTLTILNLHRLGSLSAFRDTLKTVGDYRRFAAKHSKKKFSVVEGHLGDATCGDRK